MKLILKITAGIIIAVVLLIAGCAALLSHSLNEATKKHAWAVRVQAPAGKAWSGSFGNSTVDGKGSRTLHFRDISISAANAQKQDGGHWTLRLTLYEDGQAKDSAFTRAAYGVATVSS